MWGNENEKINQIIHEHDQISDQLEKIYKSKCKGAIIRSRVKWFEEGEKNTKYFMSLEKRNLDKNTITLLRNKKGKYISTEQECYQVVMEFSKNKAPGSDGLSIEFYQFSGQT